MAECLCYTCVVAECDKDCCDRCRAFGLEIEMDEIKHRQGFYDGSKFVDFAHRDGIVRGFDYAIWHLKQTKAQHNFGKENRASLELAIKYLLSRVAREVESANEWLQQEDPTNRKITSIYLENDNNV
jgi:hypothetical protein